MLRSAPLDPEMYLPWRRPHRVNFSHYELRSQPPCVTVRLAGADTIECFHPVPRSRQHQICFLINMLQKLMS